jgi:hypothetical protein
VEDVLILVIKLHPSYRRVQEDIREKLEIIYKTLKDNFDMWSRSLGMD